MSITSKEEGERVLESILTVTSPFLDVIGSYTCTAENVVDTANSTAEVMIFCELLPSIVVNEKLFYSLLSTLLHTHISQPVHTLVCLTVSCDIHIRTYHLLSISSTYTHTYEYLPLSQSATFSPPPLHPAQPFIRGPPVDLTVNQSRQATFSCTAQGNPVPTISWTGPSANFTSEVTPGANFTVLSVLTIDSAVRAVHEGPYTCSASNGVGPSPNSSAALTVQGTAGHPPPHNSRCTVDQPYQPPAPIALQVSSTSRPHYTLQSCCHVLSPPPPLFPHPPLVLLLPQFPPLCKLSREGLWVSRKGVSL